jgi:hypothetical protein
MREYRHTQIGYVLIVSYGVVILILGALSFANDIRQYTSPALIVICLALVSFATLTVTVNEKVLTIKFGMGLIRKSFYLEEIVDYRIVKNHWYYGWAIRYTLHGWLFSVSGLWAVELEMDNGKHYRIGTDESLILTHVLEEAVHQA